MPVSIVSSNNGTWDFQEEVNKELESLEKRGREIISVSLSTDSNVGRSGLTYSSHYACILYK